MLNVEYRPSSRWTIGGLDNNKLSLGTCEAASCLSKRIICFTSDKKTYGSPVYIYLWHLSAYQDLCWPPGSLRLSLIY